MAKTLVLHFDGVDGDTITVDDATPPLGTIVLQNGAKLSSTQSKFGGTSLYLDGIDDYLSATTITQYGFPIGAPLTLELWVYFSSITTESPIVAIELNSGNYARLYATAGGALAFDCIVSGQPLISVSGGSIPTGQWVHLAAVRNAGVMKLYLDGTLVATTGYIGAYNFGSQNLYIGTQNYPTSLFSSLYVDELQYRLGEALWVADFNPPVFDLLTSSIISLDVVAEDIAGVHIVTITDPLDFNSTIRELSSLIKSQDSLNFLDTNRELNNFIRPSESILFLDAHLIGFTKLISDSIILAETVEALLRDLLKSLIFVNDTITVTGTYHPSLDDAFDSIDTVTVAKVYYDVLTYVIQTTDSLAVIKLALLKLTELLRTADSSASLLEGINQLLDTVKLLSFIDRPVDGFLADSIALSSTANAYLIALKALADLVTITDTLSKDYIIVQAVTDGLTTSDTLSSSAIFGLNLTDILELVTSIIIDGVPYQCWVLNDDEQFVSLYTNFNFTSFCEVDGVVFATKPDGVYKLGGNLDVTSEINTGVKIQFNNFGTHQTKRWRFGYFGLSGSNPALKITTEKGITKYYSIINRKAILGRESFGQELILDIREIETLDFIELVPILMTR